MLFETTNTYINFVEETDLDEILEIYNCNKEFLTAHMDREFVDVEWLRNEVDCMKNIGFSSCKIIERKTERIIGIIDFAVKEESYLSLMMIHDEYKNKGYGKEVFKGLEKYLKENFSSSIRIDVVIDYNPKVLEFWSDLGFQRKKDIKLDWSGKELSAVMMIKDV